MSIPTNLRGPYYPSDVPGYPQANVNPNRVVGPNPNTPPAQHAQRAEGEDNALARALEDLGRRSRRLAGE
jgi:hypothetical protein